MDRQSGKDNGNRYLYKSILQFPSMSMFLPSALSPPNAGGLPLIETPGRNQYRRPLAIVTATLAAALLHGYLLFWYVNRPAPLPFSAAAPLPMLDMLWSGTPSPAVKAPLIIQIKRWDDS